jgi:hypothetical protein
MFRNSILLASHGKPHVAMTLVQSVRGTFTIAGFPLSAWAFALRIWAAMMVGLYAAFWLQLESASSAATPSGGIAAYCTSPIILNSTRRSARGHAHFNVGMFTVETG